MLIGGKPALERTGLNRLFQPLWLQHRVNLSIPRQSPYPATFIGDTACGVALSEHKSAASFQNELFFLLALASFKASNRMVNICCVKCRKARSFLRFAAFSGTAVPDFSRLRRRQSVPQHNGFCWFFSPLHASFGLLLFGLSPAIFWCRATTPKQKHEN